MPDPSDRMTPLEILQAAPKAAKDAIALAGKGIVDVLGDINSVATRLGDTKRENQSELVDGEKGRRWKVRIPRTAKRSYSAKLLYTLAEGDDDPTETLIKLLHHQVLKLDWHWTNLEQYAARIGADLVITQHEISYDESRFDIGVVWRDGYPAYKPVEE